VDENDGVAVKGVRWRSAEAAGTWLHRRRVAGTEEEEEDFFFSPWPKRYGRPDWLLGQAKWAGSVGFDPGKSFPPFFSVLFLFLFSIFQIWILFWFLILFCRLLRFEPPTKYEFGTTGPSHINRAIYRCIGT
jgi:hypothetical protein